MKDPRETAQRIRDAGIPDVLNRWLTMTPEEAASIEARRTSMAKIGPKEQKQREMRVTPVTGKLKVGDKVTYPEGGAGNVRAIVQKGDDPSPALAAMTAAVIGHAPVNAPQTEQENDVKTPKKKTAPKKSAAKASKKPVGASPARPAKEVGVRPGSKLEAVVGLLSRKEGCTAADALSATGWPAISMPQQAKAAGLKLRKEKVKGEPTRYWAA